MAVGNVLVSQKGLPIRHFNGKNSLAKWLVSKLQNCRYEYHYAFVSCAN